MLYLVGAAAGAGRRTRPSCSTLVVLVFVRIGYIYPSGRRSCAGLTVTLGVVWGIAIVAIIWLLPIAAALARLRIARSIPAYYVLLSLYLHRRDDRTELKLGPTTARD